MNGLNSLMNNMDQFQGQGNNKNNFPRFGNGNGNGNQNSSLNVVQIQPTNGDFGNCNNNNNNNNQNGNNMMKNNKNGHMNLMGMNMNMNNMGNNMNNMNNYNNGNNNYNGNNMGNNNNNHNNNNNNKPSKRKAETYTCTVCSIEVSSQDVLQSHINGQKHAKKLRQIADTQANNQPKPANNNGQTPMETDTQPEQKVTTTPSADSKSILQQLNELASFNKIKVVYDVVSENGPQHAKVFEIKCSLIDTKTSSCVESVTTTGSSHVKAKQNAAEIAIKQTKLEVPSKEQLNKKKLASKNDQQRQREEAKKQKIERRQQQAAANPKPPKPEPVPKSAVEIANDEYELQNKFFIKNHLLAKHKQIQPSRDQLDLIGNLVSNIEKALKKISDKLVDEELEKLPKQPETPPTEPTNGATTTTTETPKIDDQKEFHRHLKGVVRVGTIVKTLFLKTDRDIHLVVLTSKMPTHAFVRRISDELDAELVLISKEQEELAKATESNGAETIADNIKVEGTEEVEMKASDEVTKTTGKEEKSTEYKPPKIVYSLDKSESLIKSEACVNIKCELPDGEFLAEVNDHYRVKISFTSMSLLSNPNAPADTVVEKLVSDINEEKCKNALTEIRRVKWFNARLKPIANAILILRIMRDLCQRSPTWSVLNDWLLELIIEKCFIRNKYEDITLKLRAVFECIASGVLFLSKISLQYKPNEPKVDASTEVKDATVVPKEENLNTTLCFSDPCAEVKSTESVFETVLSVQQREEITASAQNSLRLITFRKAHELLAIDLIKMPPFQPKSKHSNGDKSQKFKRLNNNKKKNGAVAGVVPENGEAKMVEATGVVKTEETTALKLPSQPAV